MALEPEEKAAGRLFKSIAQAELDRTFVTDPPYYPVPTVIAVYRHACPCRDERSSALELREQYRPSPALVVETEHGEHTAYLRSSWHVGRAREVDTWQIPEGRFGFIYREGRCRLCDRSARSRVGRLVDAWERPPVQGRVAR